MRPAEEIGSQCRAPNPGRGRQKGSNGEQKRRTDQQTTQEAEKGAAQAVRKAKADGADAAPKKSSQKAGDKSNGGQNQGKGDELGERGGGEEVAQMEREIGVTPKGQRKAEQEAGEVEGRAKEAVQRGAYGRVREQRPKQPIEWIEAGYQVPRPRLLSGLLPCRIKPPCVLPCRENGRKARR